MSAGLESGLRVEVGDTGLEGPREYREVEDSNLGVGKPDRLLHRKCLLEGSGLRRTEGPEKAEEAEWTVGTNFVEGNDAEETEGAEGAGTSGVSG